MTTEKTTITKTEYEQLIKDRIQLIQLLQSRNMPKHPNPQVQRYELSSISFNGKYAIIDQLLRTFRYIPSHMISECEQPISENSPLYNMYLEQMFDPRNINEYTDPIIVNLFLKTARHNKRLDDIKSAKLAEVEEFKQARLNVNVKRDSDVSFKVQSLDMDDLQKKVDENKQLFKSLLKDSLYEVIALDATKSKMTTAVLKDGEHYFTKEQLTTLFKDGDHYSGE
ncbi:hypothetical protein [Shewanella xiamenensis]|uniref:hypothetical protein n=1 Tax=Shewanella xiamenensis TaxID=332186 RepID=UPI0021C16930|nr:hypothetical protein [Shewanella xiamenensis]MCT8876647.1 hypothetical protein [Shewanella xiamenensis]